MLDDMMHTDGDDVPVVDVSDDEEVSDDATTEEEVSVGALPVDDEMSEDGEEVM